MHTARDNASRPAIAPLLLAIGLSASSFLTGTSALALSELQKTPGQAEQSAQGQGSEKPAASPTAPGVPMPDPLVNSQAGQGNDKTPGAQDSTKPVEVIYDISKVPEPVRKMREQIVEAAASGDLERLRPLLGTGSGQTRGNSRRADRRSNQRTQGPFGRSRGRRDPGDHARHHFHRVRSCWPRHA